jgi:divalent metal cation (Fe/Co/Zn/Cd) transporter
MAIALLVAIAIVAFAVNSWKMFAIGVIIATIMIWAELKWQHSHMHELYEGELDENGERIIE